MSHILLRDPKYSNMVLPAQDPAAAVRVSVQGSVPCATMRHGAASAARGLPEGPPPPQTSDPARPLR